MTHPIPEPELILRPPRSLKKIIAELKLEVLKSDLNILDAQASLLHNPSMDWGSDLHKFKLSEAFASPSYSEAYKRYLAARSLHDEFMFSVADQFLTEELICSYLQIRSGPYQINMDYFKAMMGSAHMSERIMETAFEKTLFYEGEVLAFTPDAMVTPRVINSWLAIYSQITCGPTAAALAIKRAHPEYEKFPDEWALKLFCGG